MADQRRYGVRALIVDGTRLDVRGNPEYSLGGEMRTGVAGIDGMHGYSVEHQVPYVQATIADRGDLDLKALRGLRDVTVVLQQENGKAVAFRNAWAAGEWAVNPQNGEVTARFEAISATEA